MAWKNRLLPAVFGSQGDSSAQARAGGLATPEESLVESLAGTPAYSGQTVSVEKALGLAPVWAAVSIISEQIQQLPLKVYRNEYDDTTGRAARIEARSHRAWSMLHDKPNPITPAGRFWSTVSMHILLWGNAFIYKSRNAYGVVDELWLLHPSQTAVMYNAATRQKAYRHTPTDLRAGAIDFSTDEVCHVMGLSQNALVGESVVGRVRNAFGVGIARDEFEGGFYKRGAVVLFVVEAPGELSETAARNVRDTINLTYGGSANAFQAGVLEEGATMHQMQMPMKDMEFIASQNLTRTDIASMFKLPPNYLGGSSGGENLTYATVEQNQLHFGLHAVAPLTHAIAQALSQDSGIMPQSIHDCEFLLDAMFRADLAARTDSYDKALGKWMTANEVRGRENLPAIGPKGDKLDIEQPPPAPPPAADPALSPGQRPPGQLPPGADPNEDPVAQARSLVEAIANMDAGQRRNLIARMNRADPPAIEGVAYEEPT